MCKKYVKEIPVGNKSLSLILKFIKKFCSNHVVEVLDICSARTSLHVYIIWWGTRFSRHEWVLNFNKIISHGIVLKMMIFRKIQWQNCSARKGSIRRKVLLKIIVSKLLNTPDTCLMYTIYSKVVKVIQVRCNFHMASSKFYAQNSGSMEMRKSLKAIFFDMDNTLIQTRKADVKACNKVIMSKNFNSFRKTCY